MLIYFIEMPDSCNFISGGLVGTCILLLLIVAVSWDQVIEKLGGKFAGGFFICWSIIFGLIGVWGLFN